jgi:endonuclease/exonuclease/phosphatase family metal-dependent hydrolase
VAALLLAGAGVLLPGRSDLPALVRVLAPYLAFLFLPLALVALLLRGGQRWTLAALAAAGFALCAMASLPVGSGAAVHAADPDAPRLRLTTWNLEYGQVPRAVMIRVLLDRAPGIVGLQELTHAAARDIAADPEVRRRFPTQVLAPSDDWDGVGLLSSWPLVGDVATSFLPPMVSATLTSPDGLDLDVLVVHAPPPALGLGPIGPRYDPTRRDAALVDYRKALDRSLALRRPVVLLGDLNLTDRELPYAELTAGLVDAHRVAGSGLGHTWRPLVVERLPFGMLRIDMVITSPDVVTLSSEPDCLPRGSDHCVLDVLAALPRS